MNQSRDISALGNHIEEIQNGRSNMGLTGANAQSRQNAGLLTPASLQIAQLQAQLTLQRLKLAQTAVGGNAAAAASVLNQVLANVPLLNPLRPSAAAASASPGSAFPPGATPFPPLASALDTLVGAGGGGGLPSQGSQGAGLAPFQAGFTPTSLGLGAGASFPSGSDRSSQYGFLGASSSSGSASMDGQNGSSGALAKMGTRPGFQRDLYGTFRSDAQSGFGGERNQELATAGNLKGQQWDSPARFSHSGKADAASGPGGLWANQSQPYRSCELYNPEEPTTDGKYGGQGIVGRQPPKPGETPQPGAPMGLQPHQRNDYHGVTPLRLPHHCTICEKKLYNLTDWDHHVNGKLHLQSTSLYTDSSFGGSTHFPPYSAGRFSSSTNNSTSFSSTSQDISSGPTAPMKTQDLTGNGFTSPQTGLKFPQRKPHLIGRVVHICNLPEGSTENDVINLGLPFGKVTNYILMRSTHQAFLEMAFMEAAQAMVQYYLLNPATINEQKLLIRMSKRYKELQLKKPGKDVESIIQDINSQKEREEVEGYQQERARSRSPVHRSLSPRPHSPAYPSSQGACRGERTNGAGASWDWSSHGRWEEEREETSWRNGDRSEDWNGDWNEGDSSRDDWPHDQRKPCPKGTDRWNSWMEDERMDVHRGSRERYPRGSPQDLASPYRNKEEEYYKMAEWSPRPHHQHSEGRAKRREAEGHPRSRQTEPEGPEASTRAPDERKLGSPARGRSKKQGPKQKIRKGEETENQVEANLEQPLKEKPASPHGQTEAGDGAESEGGADIQVEEGGNDSEIEGESWYPQNMEELVTVDEVGEEDDVIIEPDLPELQEKPAVQNEAVGDTQVVGGDRGDDTPGDGVKPPPEERAEDTPGVQPNDQTPASDSALDAGSTMEEPCSDQSNFPGQDLKAICEEPYSHTDAADIQPPQERLSNDTDSKPLDAPINCAPNQSVQITTATDREVQDQDEHFGDIPVNDSCSASDRSPSSADVDHTGLHDEAVSEHSIPLGVEFVVPRSGFFCKLCGLFYESEETAKTAHCRSTVHYKNLQKYLSQLATGCLDGMHTSSASRQGPHLVPPSKEKKSHAGDEMN